MDFFLKPLIDLVKHNELERFKVLIEFVVCDVDNNYDTLEQDLIFLTEESYEKLFKEIIKVSPSEEFTKYISDKYL